MKKLKAALLITGLICALSLSACNCGKTVHEHDYSQKTVTEPTCIDEGYTTYTCECGSRRKGDYTEPVGHNFVDNKCTRCGYATHTHEYEKTVIEPTCTSQGYTRGKCVVCGATYSAHFTDPLGHDFVDDKCTRCGVEIHDHIYEATVTEPDCLNGGYTSYKCTKCEESYTAGFIEPLGHNFVNDNCTRCGVTDKLVYTLSDDGTYYICSGRGKTSSDKIIIPAIYEGKPVGAIGEDAFTRVGWIKKVVIPDSVKTIGNGAFYMCMAMADLTVGKGVTHIGDEAFMYCRLLTAVQLPEGVNYIGTRAFLGCNELTEINIPNGVTSINDYAFTSCGFENLTIPDTVTSIGKNAFAKCKLKSLTIPDTVTFIGESAFTECWELESITIPVGVTTIGAKTFYDCYELNTVLYKGTEKQWSEIEKGEKWDINSHYYDSYTGQVIQINDFTVYYLAEENADYFMYTLSDDGTYYICKGINHWLDPVIPEIITIPSTYNDKPVKAIGIRAFENCTSLKSAIIPNSVTSIGDDAFRNSGIMSIIIPDSVTSIGDYAFSDCKNLTSVTISDSITDIYFGTFAYSGITSIIIPDNVTYILNYAFYECDNLTSITIPKGIKIIEEEAFALCPHLTDITFKGTIEEWNSIPYTYWLRISTVCTIHCTDGDFEQSPHETLPD